MGGSPAEPARGTGDLVALRGLTPHVAPCPRRGHCSHEASTRRSPRPGAASGGWRGTARPGCRRPPSRSADGRTRSAATLIYFLLPAGEASAWHRVASDEIWLAHTGVVTLELGGSGARPAAAEDCDAVGGRPSWAGARLGACRAAAGAELRSRRRCSCRPAHWQRTVVLRPGRPRRAASCRRASTSRTSSWRPSPLRPRRTRSCRRPASTARRGARGSPPRRGSGAGRRRRRARPGGCC